MSTYTRAEFAAALRRIGVRAGDVVFSHGNVGYFGFPDAGRTAEAIIETILGAVRDVIGDDGTLVVPTFTYSFGRGEDFDPAHSPSRMGIFAEAIRRRPDARRSHDPMFSVAALGGRGDELTRDVPPECFGRGCFWERFLESDGIVCNMNLDAGSTFVHYVERCLDVPYRFDKAFAGRIVEGGVARPARAVHFCRDLDDPGARARFEPFDRLARDTGVAKTARVGRGSLVALRAAEVLRTIETILPLDPRLLTQAGTQAGTQVGI